MGLYLLKDEEMSMGRIRVLDCTLRDGGYINSWKFKRATIKSIVEKSQKAKIDIIEVGFLTEAIEDEDHSLFNDLGVIQGIIGNKNGGSMIVAMIAIGEKEIDPAVLPLYDGKSIDGIRLTFHRNEVEKAIAWATVIKNKGYKVFMQPVGTLFYKDVELLKLLDKMNELEPYAFYIVDTLGSMYRNELMYMFYLIDRNLDAKIHIGFHPHNNLQLAFSNSQELSRIATTRTIIIDSSVFGMGRGAGNLPTELITQYINKSIGGQYDVTTVLEIYDEHISLIKEDYNWGYAMAYNIAAKNICHPNYASFLMNKQTLTMKDIEKIIISIPQEKKEVFDKTLIEELYLSYQNNKIDDSKTIARLKEMIANKPVLVLAPGRSLVDEKAKITDFITNTEPYVISVNFVDNNFKIDSCFVSNHKRIESIEAGVGMSVGTSVIATSNIMPSVLLQYLYVDYYSYINQDEVIFDNAGLLLFRLLIKCGIKNVTLAGFDGFKTRYNENYYSSKLSIHLNETHILEKQERMKEQLEMIKKEMDIKFLTKSIYEG